MTAYIALGSNLGDRRRNIESAFAAVAALPDTGLAARSGVLETAPEGPVLQGPFLNAAAEIRTGLAARILLEHLHAIERAHGRDRAQEQRWGPRTLDLDLLLYGDLVISEPGLTVPHPRMHERRFVLQPLAGIAPRAGVPGLGRTVAELLAGLG